MRGEEGSDICSLGVLFEKTLGIFISLNLEMLMWHLKPKKIVL